jgi:zinc protease
MRRLIALFALVAVAPIATLAQQPARPAGAATPAPAQRPPAPLPTRELQFPPFAEFELGNGLRVIVVPSEKQPVLSMRLSVLAGSLYDPAGKSGMADLVAGSLTKGAGARDAEAFAEAIERVGGSLNAVAGPDFLTVEASVLSNDRELAFSLMADALLRPSFPRDEVELLRTQTLSGLALARSQPDAIAGRIFARTAYGDHPYGRRADEASVRAITRDDLVEFHAARMRPTQALLVLAGMARLLRVTEFDEAFGKIFRRLKGRPPAQGARG